MDVMVKAAVHVTNVLMISSRMKTMTAYVPKTSIMIQPQPLVSASQSTMEIIVIHLNTMMKESVSNVTLLV